ncbi:phenylacetate--CoA ligase family protein [Aliikangiella sp. G2MR2-5]|uniref:phenylacetate--CoA ligase family protein n=1 Tax=Aliikangiella sp. G2MR2-5 TaxID=2788943 RepID=UPI0018ABD28C|nr:phenylacetate--CoA ligase family protein [Aliikangiella sp. G2MR2-5]
MNMESPVLDKFLEEVEYAYQNVPFYRKALDKLGVITGELCQDSYQQKLPLTDKRDYRKNFPIGVLAKGFSLNHPMLNKSQSSGTTGERLVTFEIGMNLLQRAITCTQVNPYIQDVFTQPNRKICRYAAPNCSDVECASPHSTLQDRLLADGTLVLPVYHDLLTTSPQLVDRAIDEIEQYKPDLFYVDPTHFAFLLREYKKRGLTPPRIPVITSYSAATEVSKRQILEFYPKTHFAEFLSSSEMGWIAMQCPSGRLHLNEESFFFELLDRNYEPAMAGDLAQLCISSIDQGALPHLRYQTGDMVTQLHGNCECGSKNRSIVIEGRESNFIQLGDGIQHSPLSIDRLIGAPDWLDLYQLEQIEHEKFILKMIVNKKYQAESENAVISNLKGLLGKSVDIRLEVVDYIASERSGKFQAVKGMKIDK